MGTVRQRLTTTATKAELAVFVSGMASMGLEILAGRIVAPQFGSSIYTWGSIIGVFLTALSLGYHRGGKYASSRATNGRLVGLLLATAAYVAVLIFASDLLLRSASTFPLPSRFASLPAITLLFGPPTYFLGFISPYGAELSAKDDVGEASGHVYAVGTIGSIVGAFATTYFLVPSLSIELIGFVFGALLVATAFVVALPSPSLESSLRLFTVAVLLVGAVSAGSVGYAVEGEVVYQTQTPYQELRVIDLDGTRTLYLNGQRHSAMDKDDPTRHVFDYTRYFHLPYLMREDVDIDRVLFVGGGGFTGPKRFAAEYNATVDVVEIDPEVIDAAKRYFRVEEGPKLNVYNEDGRQFLRETNRTYDLIVLDAYKKDKVPFQLTTVEFMELANSRLSENGVLFSNLIAAPSGPASQFYRAEYKTINQAFPQVYSFRTSVPGFVQNVEVVATKSDERLSQSELRERNRERDIGIDLTAAIDGMLSPPKTSDVPVLRDDKAPVDSLLDPMAGQRYVIEESGTNDTKATEMTRNGTEPTETGTNGTEMNDTQANEIDVNRRLERPASVDSTQLRAYPIA